MNGGAIFSPDRCYRYRLWRSWLGTAPSPCLFIMLNPSTADEYVLDPTVRRCVYFAQRWGYESLIVGNLFALRSTDPAALYGHPDPVGPENDQYLEQMTREAVFVVAAWGVHGALCRRGGEVARRLATIRPLYCLGRTQDGHPRHPLYMRAETKPVVYTV